MPSLCSRREPQRAAYCWQDHAGSKIASCRRNPPGLAVGQEWAYRANAKQPLTRVRVTKLGTQKPPRAKVYFLDDRFEGREKWAASGRLKAPWDQAGQWQAREDKRAAIEAASSASLAASVVHGGT
jgi:hypothetical protein